MQQPQDIGIYGDRLFVACFPNGRDREPNFHANVKFEDAAAQPARDSFQQVDALNRERTALPPQPQLEHGREQAAPTAGARGL